MRTVFTTIFFFVLFSSHFCIAESILEGSEPRSDDSASSGEQWRGVRDEFNEHYESLPDSGEEVISASCGGEWVNNLMNLEDKEKYDLSMKKCNSSLMDSSVSKDLIFQSLEVDFFPQKPENLQQMRRVFPEYEQSITSISDKIRQLRSLPYVEYVAEQKKAMYFADPQFKIHLFVLEKSSIMGLVNEVELEPVYKERGNFLKHYECEGEGIRASVSVCYTKISTDDKGCLEKQGFRKCRPFLKGGSCEPKAVVDLASELSKEDKNGMSYVCWKAAAQGAKCCISPDNCPTDGAFRNISSQLQKAAPGLVSAFGGLEAIKGDYQAACQANLLANASGPLSRLQTKTCGDSATVCEETCDKKVQEFKGKFKMAVLGGQRQTEEEKPLTIDELVDVAKAIHPDLDVTSYTEEQARDINTCSQAVVYLSEKFKEKTGDKKSLKLSEKLSHSSLVDCTEEVFKHSRGGGADNVAGGLGGMNPLAASACRQGHPNGPLPPRNSFVVPTSNPRGLGPGHLFGGKTRPGPGGNYTDSGRGGVPPSDEFIEPDRGPSGAGDLSGGWTDTGGSGGGPGGMGPGGGSGLSGSPSREDEGGDGDTGDNLPIAYPEAFDGGGGGFDNGGGGEMSSSVGGPSSLMQMAKYMERKDKEEVRRREEERLKRIDAQGSIFHRLSQTIRAYCQKENCPEE